MPAMPDLVRALALAACLVLAAGCGSEPATGPVPIKYGRDTCDFCRMIISDPRYAAQIRGGPDHKAFKFDDFGEGLVFLGQQAWKDDPKVELWVMDMANGKTWLDARKAFYVQVRQSPMGFNYGATAADRPGAVSFDAFRAIALKSAAAHYCLNPATAASEPASRAPEASRSTPLVEARP